MKLLKPPLNELHIHELAPLQTSTARLTMMATDPQADIEDITAVLTIDPTLTERVVTLANSAWSGSRRRITDPKDAVLRLGVARILEIIIRTRIAPVMSLPCRAYGLPKGRLWRHSIAAALSAEHIARLAARSVPTLVFSVALLHDVGKVALSRQLNTATSRRMRTMMNSGSLTSLQAERTVTGTDHAELGALIARHWRLSDRVVAAIANHHDPDSTPESLTDALHLADVLARLITTGKVRKTTKVLQRISTGSSAGRIGLNAADIESLTATVADELDKVCQTWHPDNSETPQPKIAQTDETEELQAAR